MNRLLYVIYLAAVLAIAYFVFSTPQETGDAVAADSREATFLKTAAQNGAAQIQISFDGAELARNAQVRAFAEEVIESQRPMLEDLRQIAAERQVSLPASPEEPEAKADGASPEAVPADYDKAFLERQLQLHREALAMLSSDATSDLDPDLRAFAWMTAAQVEERIQRGTELLRKIGSSGRTAASRTR